MNQGSGIVLDEKKVRKKLEEMGLSISEFSKRVLCSASTVRNALKGRHVLSSQILLSVCRALKVRPEEIKK